MKQALPGFIRFGRDICGDLAQAERREWWLSNGRGAYAAGTLAGTLTRRYHGLLIAPTVAPLGRHLVLAKADATLIDGARRQPLCSNRWGGGTIAPEGYLAIESFRLDGRIPVWRFAIADAIVEQRIWLEPGADTVYVAFKLLAGTLSRRRNLGLELALLVNGRDHHGDHLPWGFAPAIDADCARLRVHVEGHFTLGVLAQGGHIEARREVHDNFDLPAERERGLPDRGSHLLAGIARLSLNEGQWVGISAGLQALPQEQLETALQRARDHDTATLDRARKLPEFADAPPWIDQLLLAADGFLFARPLPDLPDGKSVIAGYPWFGDWGRDTMIALPGLTLATGRFETCKRILDTFARFVDRGMLPNVFPGAGDTADYNTADAALWFFEAWRAYFEATDDREGLAAAYPILAGIVDWHLRGTRHGIVTDPADGLLAAGEPGVQITWMDAKVGDWVVTPRIGKPVEINALWFNALSVMADFARTLERDDSRYRALARSARDSFARFVNPAGGLYDVIDGPNGVETTVRPNQIFAVSLPHSPLDSRTQADVLAIVGQRLLTSFGLRSIDPADHGFRPQYLGGVWQRDGSYHMGAVWAWLLGHYALAEARVAGDPQAALRRLGALREHLSDAGLGTVSEIFDGAAPHTPRGAPSQAWSVACTLEAYWRLQRQCAARTAEPPSPRRADAPRFPTESHPETTS